LVDGMFSAHRHERRRGGKSGWEHPPHAGTRVKDETDQNASELGVKSTAWDGNKGGKKGT